MVYWLIFILLEIWRNYVLIEKRKIRPNYAGSFIWRAFAGLLCVILTYKAEFDPAVNGLQYIPYTIFCATSFWLLFDPVLNLTRKKPLGYKGENSGWLDSLPKWTYWTLKLLAFGSIIAILYYYKIPKY